MGGVSGRTAADAFRLVGLKELVYYGNHGLEISRSGEVEVLPDVEPYRAASEDLEEKARQELGSLGAFAEEKGITASIHYRNVLPKRSERCKAFAEGERLGLRVTVGRSVIEARPLCAPTRASPCDISRGVRAREDALYWRRPRRLDAFQELEALRKKGTLSEILRIGVKSEEDPPQLVSEADLDVEVTEGVEELLRALVGESYASPPLKRIV